MAETAKGTPKGFEGVEAIMKGEGAMDVARGAVKQVAAEAPYALEGDKSVMMEESPFPRERVDMHESLPEDLIVEEALEEDGEPREKERKKKETAYSDEDIKEHLEKDKSIKSFLANNLRSAQLAVKSFNSRGKGNPGRKDASSREDDPNVA